MSEKLNAAAEKLREQMGDASLGGSLKFEVEGLGAIRVEGNSVSLDDSEADCTISADEETFEGLVTGDVNPTSAFMSGKLTVDGEMGLAMQLGQLLS